MDAGEELRRARKELLDGSTREPDVLRAAVLQLHEGWLTALAAALGMGADSGMALIAVGGLGRRELLPHSDLDLVLVHNGVDPQRVSTVADGLWYPLWDAHVKLDHSVRTPTQVLAVAAGDLTAALGLLESRHIAGDLAVSSQVIGPVRQQWRASIDRRLPELTEQAALRWERSGEIAHRSEPDLKHGRGGLRDLQLLEALALAQVTNRTPGLAERTPGGGLVEARTLLLDVRTELHVVTGRARDVLRAQDADEVADALALGDRFALARALSDAARTVSYSVEVGLRTARAALPRRGLASLRRRPLRRPLADDVVEHAGEVSLARGARPSADPGLVLRVALASARTGLPISGATLSTLADAPVDHEAVWPKPMRDEFLALLGTGRPVIAAIEALDRVGLWCRLLPEWAGVRDLPPRDSAHVWSVDRHLMETCAYAGALSSQVTRPDLLVLGALVHDIGKGRPGDHSVVGAQLAAQIGTRLGLTAGDTATLSAMVRHHLLL
ncbi:MAG: [protein-PII] uridylyltransferase, partial [Mycobacteriaceae bacterium]